jgi:hypothetical protein
MKRKEWQKGGQLLTMQVEDLNEIDVAAGTGLAGHDKLGKPPSVALVSGSTAHGGGDENEVVFQSRLRDVHVGLGVVDGVELRLCRLLEPPAQRGAALSDCVSWCARFKRLKAHGSLAKKRYRGTFS